jgi:hypothetical protein
MRQSRFRGEMIVRLLHEHGRAACRSPAALASPRAREWTAPPPGGGVDRKRTGRHLDARFLRPSGDVPHRPRRAAGTIMAARPKHHLPRPSLRGHRGTLTPGAQAVSRGFGRRSLGSGTTAAARIHVPHGHLLVQEVLGRCRLPRGLDLSDFGERVQRFVEEQVVLSDALMKLLGQGRE